MKKINDKIVFKAEATEGGHSAMWVCEDPNVTVLAWGETKEALRKDVFSAMEFSAEGLFEYEESQVVIEYLEP